MMTTDPLLTLVILVTGVVGGLLVVIFVIIYCKFRSKRKVTLHRKNVVERKKLSEPCLTTPVLRRNNWDNFQTEFDETVPLRQSTPEILSTTTGNKSKNQNLNGDNNIRAQSEFSGHPIESSPQQVDADWSNSVSYVQTSSSLESNNENEKQISVDVHIEIEKNGINKDIVVSTNHPTPRRKTVVHSKSADFRYLKKEKTDHYGVRHCCSYESKLSHRTNHNRCRSPNHHSELSSRAIDSVKACVRYNDPGSVEHLDDESLLFDTNGKFLSELSSPSTTRKSYSDIWKLRSTFESEENSDIEISPLEQPDENCLTKCTNTPDNGNTMCCTNASRTKLLLPFSNQILTYINADNEYIVESNENKIQKLSMECNKKPSTGNSSFDTSTDSIDAAESDLDNSDTAGFGGFKTSLESTDNTDNSSDSRFKQMRGDSGYKSMDNTQTEALSDFKPAISLEKETSEYNAVCIRERQKVSNKFCVQIERSEKTASKKRRDYKREPQAFRLYESIKETEDKKHCSSLDSEHYQNRKITFSEFIRSGSRHYSDSELTRDFSMDETTSQLFQEFTRVDKPDSIKSDSPHASKSCDGGLKHLTSLTRRRHHGRVTPDSQNKSNESGITARRISPQDSIDEEPELTNELSNEIGPATLSNRNGHCTVYEIPVLKLPEDNT